MSNEPIVEANEQTLSQRQHSVVKRCLDTLMSENPQSYYEPTSEIAREILALMSRPEFLDKHELEAVKPLKSRDIEILLAYK
ncbi:MAG: hypothetical protein AB8B79_17740 [Granulosicoccus sp.]